jgi:hypothetical protein
MRSHSCSETLWPAPTHRQSSNAQGPDLLIERSRGFVRHTPVLAISPLAAIRLSREFQESVRAEQVPQLRFLDPFVRARRGTLKPTFHLHHRDRVFRRWLAHLDVEHHGRPDMFDPRVAPECMDAENCSLEERFGLHLHRVPDAAAVSERDGADP